MKNKIYYVTLDEIDKIKKEINKKKKIFIVEINGSTIQVQGDFLDIMSEKFSFPYSVNSLDGYLDWICDLDWLKADSYALIINNFKDFLKENITLREEIIEEFEKIILPWWQEDVEKYSVGGTPKSFNVYLID